MPALFKEISEIKDAIIPIFDLHKVKRAAVFGSFARGEANTMSDIDMLVSFCDKYDLIDIIALKQDLAEKLGREIDLLTYNSLKDDEFSKNVQREAKIIYEKD